MPYRLRILSSDEAQAFAHMTFPAYRSLLGSGTVAVGAYAGKEAAGLALVQPAADRRSAELLSLFVGLPHRLRGLGSMLLRQAEKYLMQAHVPVLGTIWNDSMSGATAFKAALAGNGWSEPHRRMLVMQADVAGEFGEGIRRMGPKYEHADCVPRQYALSTWADMTDDDREFIASRQGEDGWYPPHANPFREMDILDVELSQLLKVDGRIVGWVTVHRTAPDTVRFTDVFIRGDLKRAGAVAIAMVTHGFWMLMRAGVATLTWAIEGENEPLVRMCEARLGEIARLNWTWGAQKILSD